MIANEQTNYRQNLPLPSAADTKVCFFLEREVFFFFTLLLPLTVHDKTKDMIHHDPGNHDF